MTNIQDFQLNTDYASPANDDSGTITVTIPNNVLVPAPGSPALVYSNSANIGKPGAAFTYRVNYSRYPREMLGNFGTFAEIISTGPPPQLYSFRVTVYRTGTTVNVRVNVYGGVSSARTIGSTITVRVRTFIPIV